jgi:hypothetical protein
MRKRSGFFYTSDSPDSNPKLPGLRYPKYSSAKALNILTAAPKTCSLHRPQDALHSFCPSGNHNVTVSALPVLFFYACSDCGYRKSFYK